MCELPIKIKVIFLISSFFWAAGAMPAHARNLCAEKVQALAVPAFNEFLAERKAALGLQVKTSLCTGTEVVAPMPSRLDIFAWFESAGTLPVGQAEKDEAYACFGRLFIAKAINLRVEMENCLTEPGCAEKLCSDLKDGKAVSGERKGADDNDTASSLREVYDRNAKDLMAIP